MQVTENSNCKILLGVILIAVPMTALLFGSDEPAMRTHQATLVMTAMIMIGIIMLGTNVSKQKSTPTTHAAVPQSVVLQAPAYCPQCGASITSWDVKFCAKCGGPLPE